MVVNNKKNVCKSVLFFRVTFLLSWLLAFFGVIATSLIHTGLGQYLVHTFFVSIFLHIFSGTGTTCLTLICLHILLRDAQRNPQPVVQ